MPTAAPIDVLAREPLLAGLDQRGLERVAPGLTDRRTPMSHGT
jgi:hypothetical protein